MIYPGDNYEKDFEGVTDPNGNFLYPWIIGENGDLGELVVQIEVTSPGLEPQTVTGSFNIVAPTEVLAIGNSSSEPVIVNSIAPNVASNGGTSKYSD